VDRHHLHRLQKGDLEPSHICFLSPAETDFGYYKASSETDIHARILALEGVAASIHAHTKEIAFVTLDDADKPNGRLRSSPSTRSVITILAASFRLTGWPSQRFARNGQIIPERLAEHPATIIQAHGTFAKGRTLKEAFFHVCIANNAGYVVRLLKRLKVDVEGLRKRIKARRKFFLLSTARLHNR